MKPATSLKSLAATMKPAPVPAAPGPSLVVSYRVAETRAATRRLSGQFPAAEDAQASRLLAAAQDRDARGAAGRGDQHGV